MNRVLPWLAFAGLLLCLFVKINDGDPWFHLLIGREILRTHAIPTAEFYKWPVLGQPTGFHEWGFGVLLALAERGGWWSLSLVNAVLGAGALALVAAAAVRRGASWRAAFLLLGPLAALAAWRLCYRPESALYLALGATVYALERGRWIVLPALTLALALFHPSPLILLLVAGCYAIDLAWSDRGRLPAAAALLVAAALAVRLAPYGFYQLTLPIEFTLRGDLTKSVAELIPSLRTTLWWQLVTIAACGVTGFAFARPRRISDVLLVVGFGYLAFSHVRNLPMFAMVAFGPAALALSRLPIPRFVPAVTSAAVASVFVVSPAWGAGPWQGRSLTAAADFIEAHRLSGRLMNPLHAGAYLAWRLYPGHLVAVDGRTYYGEDAPMRLSAHVLDAQLGWRDVARNANVTMIATSATWPSFGQLVPVIAELARDPEWLLATVEPAGLLFVHRDAFPARATPLAKELVWAQVLSEAEGEIVEYGRTAPAAQFARGIALFRMHDFAGAADAFASYTATAPGDQESEHIAGLLRAALHGDQVARASLEELYQQGR